jgi:hypothetical protein
MPFKSEKQRRYLFANEPEVAKKFAKDYNMGGVASMFRKRLADGDDPFYDAWKKVYETNPDAASMNKKHDEYLEKYTLEMSTQTSEAPTEDVEQTADPMLNLFSETELTTLFAKEEPQGIMAAKGGRIGFRGGGQDASSDDFGGSTSSGSSGSSGPAGGASAGGNYGGDSSGGTSANDMSGAGSNDNNSPDTGGHSRFDVGSGYYGEEVTTSSDDGGDTYKDPILDMVGKKIVKDPITGADIVVDSNAVLMKEKKLKMSKGKRPPAWVSPTTKAYYDNLDKYIADNTGLLSSYNIEKFITNKLIDQIPIIGPFIPEQYPSRNINFEKISKYEVPGSDLGFYDSDEYPEFWGKGPDENDNDGPETIIPGVIDDTNKEFIDFSLMSALDKIRANQARRKGLVEDDIIQDNETIVDNEIMTANKGGLAGLFKVKTQ